MSTKKTTAPAKNLSKAIDAFNESTGNPAEGIIAILDTLTPDDQVRILNEVLKYQKTKLDNTRNELAKRSDEANRVFHFFMDSINGGLDRVPALVVPGNMKY